MTFARASYPAPRPASASLVWVTAAGSLLLVLGLIISGRGGLARLAIPAGSVLVGLTLYLRRPIGYIHFALWTWFVTPLVRRLVDWRAGFEDHNLVLLAPILVSAIAGLTLLRDRRLAAAVRLTPFFLCIAGILYGFSVGLIRWRLHASEATSPGEIVYGLFNWLSPLLFGLHLYIRWPMYEEHKCAVQKSFLWAVLLLGAYGVYQFVAPPVWDRSWLEHMLSDVGAEAFGRPEPFQVRIWSTLNSPGTLANVLLAGLLLLFFVRSRIKPLAAAAGYSAFLLTLVRTSWLGWLVGLAVLAQSTKGRQIPRLLLSLVLLPFLVSPLMLNPQIASVVTDRLQSFQSARQDDSFQDRAEEHRALLTSLAADPFGEGLNNAESFHGYTMDSGIIQLFYGCGWIGSVLFLLGVALCARGMRSGRKSTDPIAAAYRAVLAAMILEQLSGNTLIGPSGAVLWVCIGLGLSSYQTERVSSFPLQTIGPPTVEGLTTSALVA
jgi:hypothetical protein